MAVVAALLSSLPAAAHAGELFAGIHKHDVKTPLDYAGIERGVDLSLGYRGGSIAHLLGVDLQPYVFGSVNSAGFEDYAAAGLQAKFNLGSVYLRPGVGIAVHSGSAGKYFRPDKIAFGSRVLFEPEFAIGTQLAPRVSVEASWMHMSHAQLFGPENPGIDNLGLRLNLKL
jgi:hypothetical protein